MMSYSSLRKVYYRDRSRYKQEYRERFEHADSVHIDFTVSENPAFFLPNAEISRMMFEILRVDKQISKLSQSLPQEALEQYSRRCLIDEIVLTNKIEGVRSTRREIEDVLLELEKQTEAKNSKLRFFGFVSQYRKLVHGDIVPLRTPKDIRALYDETVLDDIMRSDPLDGPDGELFRKGTVSIVNEFGKNIHNGVYPETEIIQKMQAALSFLNDETVEPLYRACIFHYLMEYIHPFYDGNGRIGRFIFGYCLSRQLEPIVAYRISETIQENKDQYYKAFSLCNDVHNGGDLTPFLYTMILMIQKAMVSLRDSLSESCQAYEEYRGLIEGLPIVKNRSAYRSLVFLLDESLFGESGASVPQLMQYTGCSSATVRRILAKIQGEGLLKTVCASRSKYYSLNLAKLDRIALEMD